MATIAMGYEVDQSIEEIYTHNQMTFLMLMLKTEWQIDQNLNSSLSFRIEEDFGHIFSPNLKTLEFGKFDIDSSSIKFLQANFSF